jgi:hypothetical protein
MKCSVYLISFVVFYFSLHVYVYAQSPSKGAEDSLSSSLLLSNSTVIGGYGSAFYQHDVNAQTSLADLARMVLFVGHSYGSISFFSELEVEDAKVSGGEEGGEIAFEQAYLKFNLNPQHYITAGLFLPRIGILNENHLPNDFNGNERTQVETFIIPSTWRELGIGFYGSLSSLPLNYSAAIVNGLNSASFKHGSGIREGRFEGRNASANNLALTGSIQMYAGNIKLQASGYYGGTVGLPSLQADSLHLASGMFGTPVVIGELDAQYEQNGFSVKVLYVFVSIPDASDINNAYGNNTPKAEYGAYAEIGYDLLHLFSITDGKQLVVFLRYEKLDMNASIPLNGILDGTLNQQHVIAGLNYLPINNIAIKIDARFVQTGDRNPALIIASSSSAEPFKTHNWILNIGIGFSF